MDLFGPRASVAILAQGPHRGAILHCGGGLGCIRSHFGSDVSRPPRQHPDKQCTTCARVQGMPFPSCGRRSRSGIKAGGANFLATLCFVGRSRVCNDLCEACQFPAAVAVLAPASRRVVRTSLRLPLWPRGCVGFDATTCPRPSSFDCPSDLVAQSIKPGNELPWFYAPHSNRGLRVDIPGGLVVH